MMTEEQLKKLKKQVCESLATDRHALLLKFPFAGNILMRMDLVPVRDVRVRTACTDGSRVYFDMDFYTRLKGSERVFVLAHECFHCVLLHLVRCQTRNQMLFNIASDMEVNHLLVSQSNGHDLQAPANLCFPPRQLEGESAEVIYEWLLKNSKKPNSKSNSGGNSSSKSSGGSGKSISSNSHGGGSESNPDDSMSYDDQSGSQQSGNSSSPNGRDTGKLEGQFDKHSYDNSPEESSEGNKVTDQWGEVGIDPDFKPTVSEDFAEKMREAVIAEVQRTQRTQGYVPSGIDGILEEILKPEIRWQEELAQFVTSCYNGKRRWLPPNRRHVYNEIYLQSRRSERINVTVAIDTSGSCVGDLPKFFGELIGLLNSFGEYDLHLIQCDAAVDKYDHYDSGNPFDVDAKAQEIEWSGGGGTSFKPPFDFVRANGIQTDCFLYFTDGYGDSPKFAPPYPVLWVLTKDGSRDFCDWGKKIYFKNSAY